MRPGRATPVLMGLVSVAALAVAFKYGVHKSDGLGTTIWAMVRVWAAAAVLFGVCGFGIVRLFLPDALRAHEALWVLPVGACAATLALTALGYAFVPFWLALPLVLAGGAALSVHAARARGEGLRVSGESGWALYLMAILVCVAMIPFLAAGFATVTGSGSDAHLAAGTGELLRHASPTGEHIPAPVDRMPVLWRSKPPIYYGLGAVATLSFLETWQALTPLITLMFGLAALGFFLLVRDLLGAGAGAALAAMGITALDRMVLHTASVPYYNQTWGYFTLPFTLILGWYAIRERSRPAAGLLALFLILGALAYPLALPIPVLALAVFLVLELRREGSGLTIPRPTRRSLLWILPAGLLLLIPLLGVLEKSITAAQVVLPGESLRNWGGDVFGFFPANQFFALPYEWLLWPGVAALLALAALALARLPRPLAIGLGTVVATFLAIALYFRQRDYGWYFEFKTLAFIAPVVLALACAGTERLRRGGAVALALLAVAAALSGRQEVNATGYALDRDIIALSDWADELPPDASVRLDIPPPEQLWGAYMLAERRVCSLYPLLGTNYPRVEYSRDADYVLTSPFVEYRLGGRPPDTRGAPIRQNARYRLYRARTNIPGPDRCSRRTVESVTNVGF